MNARAYNYIKMPGNKVERQVVVVTDDNGRYVSHHKLTAEEPFTEWVGGCYVVDSES